jgi:uncharacterized membrane protein YkvA (DUF1232 family)
VRLQSLRELARLLPQLAGLIARLSADPGVPRRVKAILAVTAAYLASPIDLIPDFVPVVGYLDDVVLVAVVLDGLLNHVSRDLLLRYWPGDAASLERMATAAARVAAWVPGRLKARVFGGAAA